MEPLPPLDQIELQTAVHAALTDWTRTGVTEAGLARQLLLVRERMAQTEEGHFSLTAHQATNALLEEGVERLAAQDETGAKVLRARFYDGEITRQVAARMHASPDQINRWQRLAIENLTGILMAWEMKIRDRRTREVMDRLPPAPYDRLFGGHDLRSEIAGQLTRSGEPLVVALSGIGGIGKTSLADSVLRLVAPTLVFERMLWIRADGDPFADKDNARRSWTQVELALYQALVSGDRSAQNQEAVQSQIAESLRDRPALICIDNLEQEEQTVYCLEQVRHLAGPSKFLLTTRARPTVSAPAYFRSLEELSFDDAASLLRHQAQTTGSGALEAVSDEELTTVYEAVGGNPLALRLVAGLAAVMALPDILSGLERSRPGPIEDMYKRIYWQAWRSLSDEGRALLQAMPLVAESGGLPQQLQAISGLSEGLFWPAVHELFARSLLEVSGTVQKRRYGIHQLTETFLRTEIVDWPEEAQS